MKLSLYITVIFGILLLIFCCHPASTRVTRSLTSDNCQSERQVQIVFVQDRTFTFNKFIQQFAKVSADIVKAVQKDFPNAVFGYTAFADYDVKLKKHFTAMDRFAVNSRTSCYELIKPFTNDQANFRDAIMKFAKLPPVNGAYDPPESSMTGILYTVGDRGLAWDRDGSKDAKKILILVTDEDTTTAKDAPKLSSKPKPKGDGNDNCIGFGIPDTRFVGDLMFKSNFSIIGLLAKNGRPPGTFIDIVKTWEKHFWAMGVPHHIEFMKDPNTAVDNIAGIIANSVRKIVCTSPAPSAPPPKETPVPKKKKDDSEESSSGGKNSTKLQVTLVLDRTQKFAEFTRELAKKAKVFVGQMKKMFPEVEFGITAYADFPLFMKKGAGKPKQGTMNDIDPRFRCYERILPLTSDGRKFLKSLTDFSEKQWIHSYDPPDSSMTALLYTAADTKMRWDTTRNPNLYKVIIIVTNEDTVGLKDAPGLGSKPKPTGDGEDTCTEHSFPDINTVRKVLKRKSFELVALIAPNNDRKKGWPKINPVSLWTSYFQKIGVDFHIERLQNTLGTDLLAKKLIRGVKVVVFNDPDDLEEAEEEVAKESTAVEKPSGGGSRTEVNVDVQVQIQAPVITKLQMVYVIERSKAFRTFLTGFIEGVVGMMADIRKSYVLVEVGFVAFDDFDQALKEGKASTNPLRGKSCYELIQPLTQSDYTFRKKLEEFHNVTWKSVAPDPPSSSLTALMYTAADTKMGWDLSGAAGVKKLIVLVTNEEPNDEGDAPGLAKKPKPEGEGKDTCTKHSFATPELVASELTEHSFSLIALIGPNKRKPLHAQTTWPKYPPIDTWCKWDRLLSSMGVEYMMSPIPIDNVDAEGDLGGRSEDVPEITTEGPVDDDSLVKQDYKYMEWFEDLTTESVGALTAPPSESMTELTDATGAAECTSVTNLQVVFVLDKSAAFKLFIKELAMMSRTIVEGVQKEFPDASFGLTTFSDFHAQLKNGSKVEHNVNPETSCFQGVIPVTPNVDDFVKQLNEFSKTPEVDGRGDAGQSSMTALLYTAFDKKMNWQAADTSGGFKVMVLVTNSDTVSEKDGPNLKTKPKPTGNGEDTCTKHSFPDISTVAEKLKDSNFQVIAMLAQNTHKKEKVDVVSIWDNYLSLLGVAYHIDPLEMAHVPGGITDRLVGGLKVVSCKTAEGVDGGP